MKQKIKDREGQIITNRECVAIREGDFVSLDGNITADNSMGSLPNGWTFDEDDIFEVWFDPTIDTWSIKTDVRPDSEYNVKYLNHATALLHSGQVTVVDK